MEKTNLKLAQDYACILKKERGVNKVEFVAFYTSLVTAYATLSIAEYLHQGDAPGLTEEYWEKAEKIAKLVGS